MIGITYFNSPAGLLQIKADDHAITELSFVSQQSLPENSTPALQHCTEELKAYFSGELKHFTSKLNPQGTDFQLRVWEELKKIPFGKTISYTELAIRLGDLKSIRAVGLANGKNLVAILIPCHRVIGKGGDLVGYAGGLERKKWLLQHEGVLKEQLQIF